MSSRRVQPGTFKFVIIAVILMVLADRFLFEKFRDSPPLPSDSVQTEEIDESVLLNTEPKLELQTHDSFDFHYPSGQLRDVLQENAVNEVVRETDKEEGAVEQSAADPVVEMATKTHANKEKLWLKHSVEVSVPDGWNTVAIVIDDLGESRKYSYESIDLKPPMTMALLPYSRGVDEMAAKAVGRGHEVIIHMPMEPMNPDLDTGTIALKVEQAPAEFSEMLGKAFNSMEGYVGINNHMGSRLTQDQRAMNQLMQRLKKEGLLFLDSRTISNSVAGKTAKKYDVPYAIRDVFLDHDPSEEGVRKSVERLERVVQEHGHAIAIGHPKANTVKVLREWVETLDEKQIKLVPISYSVKRQGRSDQIEPDSLLQ